MSRLFCEEFFDGINCTDIMSDCDERTKLLSNDDRPQYAFNSSIARERKKKIKVFQSYMCALVLGFVFILFIMSMVFAMLMTFEDALITDIQNPTETASLENFNSLLLQSWPLCDKWNEGLPIEDTKQLEAAMIYGKKSLDDRDKLEERVPPLPVDSPSYRHQKVTPTSKKALQLSRIGYLEEYGMKYMKGNSTYKSITKICPSNPAIFLQEFCYEIRMSCNEFSGYRSFDGTCNNLKRPQNFGSAFRQFRRSIPAEYGDGISSPRLSKSGKPLPTARTVSLVVHRPYYRDDDQFSVMLAVWGQFLDHDITATALSKNSNGSSISCCIDRTILHPECFPVIINNDDPLSTQNVSCMEFVRSGPAPTCCLGPREQMNQVTAFIDGSVIYGVEQPLVDDLRTMQGGLLKMYVTKDNRTLLPISQNLNDGCNREEAKEKGEYCFEAGDSRSNENLHLTSMHTLWARQHNKIARNLSDINPDWNDERLFQETRKILGAQMQHISYSEFLPILLGSKLMNKFHLYPQKTGYFHGYNDSIDATIANNFATAAFRFAHTIIPGLMKLLANDSSSTEYVQMHTMLFNPFKLYQPGEMDRAMRGAMNTNIEASDPYFTNELKQHLFERDNDTKGAQPKKYGLDLVSLNIQRGRDHGLPGYTKWREHCGFKMPLSFDDLTRDMDSDSLNNMKSLYENVDDIDLYTGALSEKPLNGSIIGPTLTCLIMDQFIRLKNGDRYWYENPHVFTPKQLDEIRKTTLANIICDNSDDVTYTQPLVMERVRGGNENISCEKTPRMNLTMWKEELKFIPVGDRDMEIKTQITN